MLRQTCLLLPDQAAGDSVAALLRWYGESIDEHLTIRITVRQRRGMNRVGALERHQASIQCWPHAALCRDPQSGVWLLGSKFAQKVLVSAMPNSGKGNGEEIETFWNRSCLFSVLQYSDMGIVAEVSHLLQIAVSALHCSVEEIGIPVVFIRVQSQHSVQSIYEYNIQDTHTHTH